MILNTFALASLFVDVLSLLLIAGAAGSALYFRRRIVRSEYIDERSRARNGLHLSFLFLSTAFFIRLASWPLFYFLLHSLVPVVPGAMCIYGVTKVMPAFVSFLEILKPFAFFLIGGWLILYRLDLSLKTRPLMDRCIRYLIVVSAVAVIDAIAELVFVFVFSPPGVAVSCCTAVADIGVPATPLLPVALFAGRNIHALLSLFYGFSAGLIAFIGLLLLRRSSSALRRSLLFLLAVAAILNGAITYCSYREYLGPRLMRLPDHHCLYCLLQYRPVSILIFGLFVLGSFSAVWPLLLNILAASNEAAERRSGFTRSLLRWSLVCLASSLILTII